MPNGEMTEEEKAFWEWVEANYSKEQVAVLRGDPQYKAQPEQLKAVRDYYEKYIVPGLALPGMKATDKQLFWQWASKVYSPEDVAILRQYDDITKTTYFDYFTSLGLAQWDIEAMPPYWEALPLGRPQAEKYGISEQDWKVLLQLGGNRERTEGELRRWISTGYINEYQARDIWDELGRRLTTEQGRVAYGIGAETTYENQKNTILSGGGDVAGTEAVVNLFRQRMQDLWNLRRRLNLPLTQKDYENVYQEAGASLTNEQRADVRKHAQFQPREAPWPEEPEIEYGTAETHLREYGIPQTENWKYWFRSAYPRLVQQFEAQLPEWTTAAYPGLTAQEAVEKRKKSWAEWLTKRKPTIREEYYGQTPYERGERPTVFQPRITTVRWR